MADFNKFECFAGDLGLGVHNLNTGTINIYLSNAAPSTSADTIKTDLAEIATGGGYSGPSDTQNTFAEATGTGTLTGTAVTFTATSGGIDQFQYVVLYNDTPTSPLDPLIGWWDRGSALDLAEGDSFTWKPNNSDTTGTILTVA